MPFPTFWDFGRRSSLNINGIMAISKFDLLFILWPSYGTFVLQKL